MVISSTQTDNAGIIRRIGIEKICVYCTCALGLAGSYLVFWPATRNHDPLAAICFVPACGMVQAAWYAGILLLLSAISAVITAPFRFSSTLAAALVAIGGISLRSPALEGFLWAWPDRPQKAFALLLLDVVLVGFMAAGAWGVIWLVRRSAGRAFANLGIRGQMDKAEITDGGGDSLAKSLADSLLNRSVDRGGGGETKDQAALKLARSICFVLVAFPLTIICILLLLGSADRGQVIFALFAGSLAGSYLAHELFPGGIARLAWIGPLIVGGLFYTLAWTGNFDGTNVAWSNVPLYARALPIDWVSFGSGGAMAGVWFSERSFDLRKIESNNFFKET